MQGRGACLSFVAPNRELVTARVLEVETAAPGELERLLYDLPTSFLNLGHSHVEIIRIEDDQRATA